MKKAKKKKLKLQFASFSKLLSMYWKLKNKVKMENRLCKIAARVVAFHKVFPNKMQTSRNLKYYRPLLRKLKKAMLMLNTNKAFKIQPLLTMRKAAVKTIYSIIRISKKL